MKEKIWNLNFFCVETKSNSAKYMCSECCHDRHPAYDTLPNNIIIIAGLFCI